MMLGMGIEVRLSKEYLRGHIRSAESRTGDPAIILNLAR